MCGTMVASSIIETLDRMRADEELFTAFDVTKEVRLVVSDTVLHKDVRNIVNQEFLNGGLVGYDRELCTLNIQGSPSALVYFPTSKSAEDHPLVSEVNDTIDDTDDGKDVVTATAEGRINIPKKMLDKITPVGGSYDLVFAGTLYPKKANKDGRVRISLNDLGINSNKVKITVNNDTIQIETV